jgi:hypothetical protein
MTSDGDEVAGDIRERSREEKLEALTRKEEEVGEEIVELAERALERRRREQG